MAFKRVLVPVLFVGIILAMSNSAFAQTVVADCSLSQPLNAGAGATARGTQTGHTEPVSAGPNAMGVGPGSPGTGDLRITCQTAGAGGASSGIGVLTVSFGTSITNSTNGAVGMAVTAGHPPTAPIRVVFPTSATTATPAGPAVNKFAAFTGMPQLSNSGGTLSYFLSTTGLSTGGNLSWAPGEVGVIDTLGILVSLNSITSGSLNATLTVVPGAGYTVGGGVGTNATTVVTSVVAPLTSDKTTVAATLPTDVATALIPGASTVGGPANFNLVTGSTKQTFVVRIEENYQDFFKGGSQFNGGGTFPSPNVSSTQIDLRFAGIPAGIQLGGCGVVMTDLTGTAIPASTVPFIPAGGGAVLSATSVTSGAPTLTVNFTAQVNQNSVDVVWVACTTVTNPGLATTLPSTPITVQVTAAPTGSALSATGGLQSTVTTGQVPRYQAQLIPSTALTVVAFPAAQSALLIPFATVGGGYDTGIAISNTTTDNLGTPSVATAQNGTITFTFYDNSGTVKTYTTAASSPGGGLSSGVLNTGKTYVVNLSELLKAAGMPSTFTGYIFVTPSFTHSHGAAYVYNGAGFTSATPVLVMVARTSISDTTQQ